MIVFGGPLTLGALAAAEQVRPPTMTRLVAPSSETGWSPASLTLTTAVRCCFGRPRPAVTSWKRAAARRTASLARRLAALPPDDLAPWHRAAELLERLARQPE